MIFNNEKPRTLTVGVGLDVFFVGVMMSVVAGMSLHAFGRQGLSQHAWNKPRTFVVNMSLGCLVGKGFLNMLGTSHARHVAGRHWGIIPRGSRHVVPWG
jgi:hypothetical protein